MLGGINMNDIGIRNLKSHASSIMRNVWKKKNSYLVTCRGRPVGLLRPIETTMPKVRATGSGANWEKLELLSSKIASDWKPGESAVKILSDMRR
jgi:antitoxin (DNA-binding transcriptional repressor) of toxin-antitoxin stability system